MKFTLIFACLLLLKGVAANEKQLKLEDIERDNVASERKSTPTNYHQKQQYNQAKPGNPQPKMQYGFVPMKNPPNYVPKPLDFAHYSTQTENYPRQYVQQQQQPKAQEAYTQPQYLTQYAGGKYTQTAQPQVTYMTEAQLNQYLQPQIGQDQFAQYAQALQTQLQQFTHTQQQLTAELQLPGLKTPVQYQTGENAQFQAPSIQYQTGEKVAQYQTPIQYQAGEKFAQFQAPVQYHAGGEKAAQYQTPLQYQAGGEKEYQVQYQAPVQHQANLGYQVVSSQYQAGGEKGVQYQTPVQYQAGGEKGAQYQTPVQYLAGEKAVDYQLPNQYQNGEKALQYQTPVQYQAGVEYQSYQAGDKGSLKAPVQYQYVQQPQQQIQYVVDNQLQQEQQQKFAYANAPQFVYLQQPNQEATNSIQSVVDSKGNVQYVMYLPGNQIKTDASLEALLQNYGAKTPQIPTESGSGEFKHQPKSLLDSYVPSYLQYEYYKKQQESKNAIKAQAGVKLAGKGEVLKKSQRPATSYAEQHQGKH